jgi:hypothetical protein
MNNNVVRVGQLNGAGSVDAGFLKLWSGEVLTGFDQNVLMSKMTRVKTISKGGSYAFPNVADFSARYHTPGTELQGSATTQNETIITIDDLLIADVSVANIDEARNAWDARSIYTERLSVALAQQLDRHLMQLGVLAARSAGAIAGRPGGSIILQTSPGAPASAQFATNGSHLAAAIFMAAEELDEKNVPENDRYMIVRPQQYYNLVRSTDVINRDWGGQGAYADGKVLRVAGINIVKSNNLPSGVVANGTVQAGTANRYAGDFTNTVGLVFHKDALATVKLFDLAMEAEYTVRRQSTLVVAKYAMGHGILRPEAAVEIRAANA